MGKNWMFHVRHSAKPTAIKEVLLILHEQEIKNVQQMLEIGRDRGYSIGTVATSEQSIKENPVRVARDLGLVHAESLSLTEMGQQMVALMHSKPKTVEELLHYLNYSTWDPSIPEQNCFSWSYKTVCDILWERNTVTINRQQLVSWLDEMAHDQFEISHTSLSNNSILGIMNWLWELTPAVLGLEERGKVVFSRRSFCPPELFTMAVDFFYRHNHVEYQTNMLLDPAKQESICKVCLLDPTSFDDTLEWACGQFEFIRQGASGGWGRYLLLSRAPTLADFTG